MPQPSGVKKRGIGYSSYALPRAKRSKEGEMYIGGGLLTLIIIILLIIWLF